MINPLSKATSADASALSLLVNSAYRGDSSRVGWTTEADLLDGTRIDEAGIQEVLNTPGHSILKYTQSNEIMGCVEMKLDQGKLYLGMLTVSPKLQGKGIGKLLMKAVESEAKTLGCLAVYMTVITERQELIDWYKRQGYVDTGERKPFAFNDPRFGQPKKPLKFLVLEKVLG